MDRRIEGNQIVHIDVLKEVYGHIQTKLAWIRTTW